MAQLENKGTTYFSSLFVLTSTNRSIDSVASILTNPDATRRRVHIAVTLKHLSAPSTPMSHTFTVTTCDGQYNDADMTMQELIGWVWNRHQIHKTHHEAGKNYTDNFDILYPPTVVDPVATGLTDAVDSITAAHSKAKFDDLTTDDLAPVPPSYCNSLVMTVRRIGWNLSYPARFYRRVLTRAEQVTDNFFAISEVAVTALRVAFASACAALLGTLGYLAYKGLKKIGAPSHTALSEFEVFENEAHSTIPRVTQKKQAVHNRPLQFHTTHAHNAIDQLPIVTKNVVHFSIAGQHHYATFIKSRSCFTVAHSFLGAHMPTVTLVVNNVTYNFHNEDYTHTVLRDLDLVFFTFPNVDSNGQSFPEFKDISSYLFDADFLHGSGAVDAFRVFPTLCTETTLSLTRQAIAYYHDDSDRTILGLYLLTSPTSSQAGFCGAPYVSRDAIDGKCLLGLIVAGSPYHTCIRTVSSTLFRDLMLKHSTPTVAHSRKLVPVTEGKFKMGQTAMYQIEIDNIPQHLSSMPSGHGFIPNPRANASLVDPFCPAPLSGQFLHEGVMKTPLEIACGKFQRPPPELEYPPSMIKEIVHDVLQRLLGNPTETRLSPLTAAEAYWGTSTIPGFDPNSSLGYPLKKQFKNHRALQEAFPDRTLLPMPLMDGLEDIQNDNFAFYPFCGSLKTEIIDSEKAARGKCRLFYAGSTEMNLLIKMYFGTFAEAIHRGSLRKTSCAVGTPFGIADKDRYLVDQFRKNSDSICADGDLQWFDGSHFWQIISLMLEGVLAYYHPIHHAIMRKIFHNIYHPHVALGMIIYLLKNCMPSGAYATAEFNSLYLEIQIRCALKTMGCLQDLSFLCTYGDDFVLFMKKGSNFNGKLFCKTMRAHGLYLTTTDKALEYPDSMEYDKLSFCKRYLINGAFVLPLSHLISAGGWKKKSKMYDTGLMAIGAALYEATRYNDNHYTFKLVLEHYLQNTTYTRQELIDASAITFAHSAPSSPPTNPPREIKNAIHTHDLLSNSDFPDLPHPSVLETCPECHHSTPSESSSEASEPSPPADFELEPTADEARLLRLHDWISDAAERVGDDLPVFPDSAIDPEFPDPFASSQPSNGHSSPSRSTTVPDLIFSGNMVYPGCTRNSCDIRGPHTHDTGSCVECGSRTPDHARPCPVLIDPEYSSEATSQSSDPSINIAEYEAIMEGARFPYVVPVERAPTLDHQPAPLAGIAPTDFFGQRQPNQALTSTFMFDDVSINLPSAHLNVIHGRANFSFWGALNDIVTIRGVSYIRRPEADFRVPYPVWLAMEESFQLRYAYGPRSERGFPSVEYRNAIDGILLNTPNVIHALTQSECVGSVVRSDQFPLANLPNAVTLADGITWQVNYDSPIMLFCPNVSHEYPDVVLAYLRRPDRVITCSLIDSVATLYPGRDMEELIEFCIDLLHPTPKQERRIIRQLLCSHAHFIGLRMSTFFHLNHVFRVIADILFIPIHVVKQNFRFYSRLAKESVLVGVGSLGIFIVWLINKLPLPSSVKQRALKLLFR
jgi:hypothetical protein